MNKFKVLILFVILLFVSLETSSFASLSKINGGGIWPLRTDFDPPEEITTTVTLSIKQLDENGDAKGMLNIVGHDSGLFIHASMTCLHVDGDTAWFSGIIIKAKGINTSFIGGPIISKIIDNGKPSRNNPNPDFRTPVYFLFAGSEFPSCTLEDGMFDGRAMDLSDLENGNVNIK